MQEIKFRCRDKKTNKIIAYEFLDDNYHNGFYWKTEFVDGEIRDGILSKDNIIREQFINRKDKNNKEIYVGDILTDDSGKTTSIVEFKNDFYFTGFGFNNSRHSVENFELYEII